MKEVTREITTKSKSEKKKSIQRASDRKLQEEEQIFERKEQPERHRSCKVTRTVSTKDIRW